MTEILLQVALNTITRPFMNLTMTGNTHSKVKYKYVYKNNYGYAENYIEEEQTTQWPKRKSTKVQTTIYKTYI
jgi:hypothetical protein